MSPHAVNLYSSNSELKNQSTKKIASSAEAVTEANTVNFACQEFFEKKSRWALASAFNESKDSDGFSNTLFTEKIIDFLELSDKDFRVSELVEYVKEGFEINIFQQPQGAPLQIRGHEGKKKGFKGISSK